MNKKTEVLNENDGVERQEIPQDNTGAQLFFSQIIELFNSGTHEVVIDYHKKDGESGKIKVTLESIQ